MLQIIERDLLEALLFQRKKGVNGRRELTAMAIGKSKEARPRQGVRNECNMFRLLRGLLNDQALSVESC